MYNNVFVMQGEWGELEIWSFRKYRFWGHSWGLAQKYPGTLPQKSGVDMIAGENPFVVDI